MKKVLLLTHTHPIIHGQAAMAAQLAEVAKEWKEVRLWAINTSYVQSREQLGSGSLAKLKKLFAYARQAVALIRREDIQIVIVTPGFFRAPFLKDAWMIQYLKKHTNAAIWAWVHMDPARLLEEKIPKIVRQWGIKQLQKVDQWVACAPSLQQQWPSFIPAKRTAVANGIPDLAAACLPRTPRTEGRFLVTYLSAIDPEKGWRELFAVAKKLCLVLPDIEFHFYGNVAQRECEDSVKHEFASSGHQERIKWHGAAYGEIKTQAYLNSDLFVFPSHTEQFAITVLEAMSFALPIIATKVGAIADALPETCLIPRNDDLALEKMILAAYERRDSLALEGQQHRQRFLKDFSIEAYSHQWETLLRNNPNQATPTTR